MQPYIRVALGCIGLMIALSGSAFGQNEQDLFDAEAKLNIQDEKKLSTKSKGILKNLRDAQLTSNTKIVKLRPINDLRNLPNITITINEQKVVINKVTVSEREGTIFWSGRLDPTPKSELIQEKDGKYKSKSGKLVTSGISLVISQAIDGMVMGSMMTDEGEFWFRLLEKNIASLTKIDYSAIPPDLFEPIRKEDTSLHHLSEKNSQWSSTSHMKSKSQSSKLVSNTPVTILVAYTPNARMKLANQGINIEDYIWNLIAQTQNILVWSGAGSSSSGTAISLSSYKTMEVNYSEPNWGDQFINFNKDLEALNLSNDGKMDNVHEERARYKADLVILLVDRGNFYVSGIAQGGNIEDRTFAIVDVGASSNWTFAHELGHLFGAGHEYTISNGIAGGVTSYAYGFFENLFSPTMNQWIRYTTIMSSDGSCGPWIVCPRVPRFSNPYNDQVLTFDGGSSFTIRYIGHPDKADVARLMRENAPSIANKGDNLPCNWSWCPNLAKAEMKDEDVTTQTILDVSAYPNPFTNFVTFEYHVPINNTEVSIEVFDLLGRKIETVLPTQLQDSGNHVVQWKRKDEKSVSNGNYMYRIQIGSKQFTKPITAIK